MKLSDRVRALCLSRNFIPLPPHASEVQGPKEGLRERGNPPSKRVRSESYRRISKALCLDNMYLPNTWLSSYHKLKDSQVLHCASLPNGRVLGSNLVSSVYAEQKPKFKYSDSYIGVNRYLDRISTLSFLTRVIAEYGLTNKAYKTVKRLHLVAFTCPYRHLKRMVRKATRECGYRYDISRNPSRISRCKRKPSLTGETKSVDSLNGIPIPLWEWKARYKRAESWENHDEDMW